MIDYDDRARRWLAGELDPSIGRDAWHTQASDEAAHYARILAPYGVRTLLEVGSGFGRLTPHLAQHFDHIIAIDTIVGMQECTLLACPDDTCNVSVRHHALGDPYPVADAALVWDTIDVDWTPEQADTLIADVLRSCLIVLVGNTRIEWEPMQGQLMAAGRGWWLIQGDVL